MAKENNRLLTGIVGLDEILKGGFIPERFYLVRGGPGTGKTTFGIHFLTEALKNGDETLFITMTEPAKKIKENGEQFGFNMDQINFVDLSPDSDFIQENKDYDIFPSSQMEQGPLMDKIIKSIKKIQPKRIFFDGITQFKYLASDQFNFRKQILSFIQFIMKYNVTVLLTSEFGESASDDDLQFLVDGIINLEYRDENHFLEIIKYRGSAFKKGVHSFKFKNHGIEIYPQLQITSFNNDFDNSEMISSGIPEIDQMLNGGIEKGTTTTITGPSGVGKTTLGTQFIKESAGRGLKSIIYTFEENYKTLLGRSKSINIPLDEMSKNNNLIIKKVNPLEYTPDEFSNEVRTDVEKNNTSIVMLDSVSGYYLSFKSLAGKRAMARGLHALSEYLKSEGVTVFMINEMKNITGDFKATDENISYLADNIIFLRYIEVAGRLEKAIGVLKKRMSGFENTMREFEISKYGIKMGRTLEDMSGILSGRPEIKEVLQEDQ